MNREQNVPYDFLMFYDGSVKRFTMDKFDKRHLFVNGEYDSMRTDDLSKWAVFDAMSIDRDNML